MIHRLVNLDYPETLAERIRIAERQAASRKVTRKPIGRTSCSHCVGQGYSSLVTTPTRLTPLSKRFESLLRSVSA